MLIFILGGELVMKKGIFGGTFDPIHNGHLYIAYEAMEKIGLDEIVFMPSGNPPHKTERKKTDANIRYELVKMAVREENRFTVNSFEIDNQGLSYTYKTVEHFKNLEPDTEWYFITGADCLAELGAWKCVDRILKACTLMVFNREGYNREYLIKEKKKVEELYKTKIMFLEVKPYPVSSTEIRHLIMQHREAGFLIPSSVYNTILELQLYNERV
jgi:nicotinate-nucleotide adenylyltransferase